MLEKIAARFRGTATVFKVDAGRCPELTALFQVRSVPTMILFAGGKISRRFTGVPIERISGGRATANLAEAI